MNAAAEAPAKKPKYELVKLSSVEKTVNELVKRFDGIVYDVTTTKGMDTAKKDRAELRTARGNLETARKEEKADVLERGKFIDATAKGIGEVIEKYEKPLADQIEAEEDRKKKIKEELAQKERDRIAAIQDKIRLIQGAPGEAVFYPSAKILIGIAAVEKIAIDDSFGEFVPAAQVAKDDAIAKLKEIHAKKVTEEEEAERVRLQGLDNERKDAIRQKMTELAMPSIVPGTPAVAIAPTIDFYRGIVVTEEDYQEFTVEAEQLHASTLNTLVMLHNQTVTQENAAAQLEKDQTALREQQEEFDKKVSAQEALNAAETLRVDTIKEKIRAFGVRITPNMTSADVAAILEGMKSFIISPLEFQEFAQEAAAALELAITDLVVFRNNMQAEEDATARKKKEQEDLAAENLRLEKEASELARRQRMEVLAAILEVAEDAAFKDKDARKQIAILASRALQAAGG